MTYGKEDARVTPNNKGAFLLSRLIFTTPTPDTPNHRATLTTITIVPLAIAYLIPFLIPQQAKHHVYRKGGQP